MHNGASSSCAFKKHKMMSTIFPSGACSAELTLLAASMLRMTGDDALGVSVSVAVVLVLVLPVPIDTGAGTGCGALILRNTSANVTIGGTVALN